MTCLDIFRARRGEKGLKTQKTIKERKQRVYSICIREFSIAVEKTVLAICWTSTSRANGNCVNANIFAVS
jgi:hypothetical protein